MCWDWCGTTFLRYANAWRMVWRDIGVQWTDDTDVAPVNIVEYRFMLGSCL